MTRALTFSSGGVAQQAELRVFVNGITIQKCMARKSRYMLEHPKAVGTDNNVTIQRIIMGNQQATSV